MKTVCVFGDSVALGRGDETAAGWPLRLATLEGLAGHDLTIYNLSVAQDTSIDIADRWQADCRVRLRRAGTSAGLVFAFGLYDMADEAGIGAGVGGSGALRVPLMDSMVQAEAIVGAAVDVRPVLWIGPPPIRPQTPPQVEDGHWMKFSRARLEALNAAYEDIARRLRVPYLNLVDALADSTVWRTAQKRGNGIHPCGDGHAAIAHAVHAWPAWRLWMDGAAMVAGMRMAAGASGGMRRPYGMAG